MFDDWIVRWENRLFNGLPSTYLSARFPSVALSEYLHLCYLSYYFIPVFLPTMLYFRGKGEAFFETLFAELFTFNICLIWYIFFPVAGPRYISEKIKGPLANRPLFRLTHAILSRASTKGTAFPSSHSAIAIARSSLWGALRSRQFRHFISILHRVSGRHGLRSASLCVGCGCRSAPRGFNLRALPNRLPVVLRQWMKRCE